MGAATAGPILHPTIYLPAATTHQTQCTVASARPTSGPAAPGKLKLRSCSGCCYDETEGCAACWDQLPSPCLCLAAGPGAPAAADLMGALLPPGCAAPAGAGQVAQIYNLWSTFPQCQPVRASSPAVALIKCSR